MSTKPTLANAPAFIRKPLTLEQLSRQPYILPEQGEYLMLVADALSLAETYRVALITEQVCSDDPAPDFWGNKFDEALDKLQRAVL